MLPIALSVVGGLLPAIIDAFRSGKSPEEAAKIIAPKRQEMIDRFIGSGMNSDAAEKEADIALKDEFAKAQLPEPLNPWLSTGLMALGAYGGYKVGKGIQAARAAKSTPAVETAAKPATEPAAAVAKTEPAPAPSTAVGAAAVPERIATPLEREAAMNYGMSPFPNRKAPRRANPRTRADNVDVAKMLAGSGPFG